MKCERCGNDYSDSYYRDEYSDEIICEECLLEIDGITTSSITYYYLDGEYIGDDSESIQDVIDCICDNTSYKEIKEN
jgi:hypothetical protein